MPLRRHLGSLLLSAGLVAPVPALAGGFYLQEQSPKETGRAMSGGAAAADDPSTVYFNPAAMTNLPGIQLSAGGVALFATAQQTNRGSTRTFPRVGPLQMFGDPLGVVGGSGGNPFEKVIPIPSLYITGQATDRLWLGLGVNAPFGLKLEYDDGFFGRYDSLYTDLKTYNIQPSAAYKLNGNFSVGGGVDVQYVKVTLTNALPQFVPIGLSPPTSPVAPLTPSSLVVFPDGLSSVKGNDWSIGWNAGLFYSSSSGDTHVGVHYRSRMKHDLKGTQTVSGLLPPLAAANGTFDVSAPLDLPDIVTVSLTQTLTPGLRAMLTARWYNWSVFRSIAITSATGTSVKELDYHDSYSVSAGADYDVNQKWTLRAGTMFDRTPTNNRFLTTRVPDGDRVWLSGGATWNMSDSLAVNLSYAHNFVTKANIIRPDSYFPAPATVTVTTRSQTSGNADQIAASITARF